MLAENLDEVSSLQHQKTPEHHVPMKKDASLIKTSKAMLAQQNPQALFARKNKNEKEKIKGKYLIHPRMMRSKEPINALVIG